MGRGRMRLPADEVRVERRASEFFSFALIQHLYLGLSQVDDRRLESWSAMGREYQGLSNVEVEIEV